MWSPSCCMLHAARSASGEEFGDARTREGQQSGVDDGHWPTLRLYKTVGKSSWKRNKQAAFCRKMPVSGRAPRQRLGHFPFRVRHQRREGQHARPDHHSSPGLVGWGLGLGVGIRDKIRRPSPSKWDGGRLAKRSPPGRSIGQTPQSLTLDLLKRMRWSTQDRHADGYNWLPRHLHRNPWLCVCVPKRLPVRPHKMHVSLPSVRRRLYIHLACCQCGLI
ncbi:hypothetical protein V8C35DRAFT_155638 [Trichoderma chlorosporum]